MFKLTALFSQPSLPDNQPEAKKLPAGYLLINDADEIIYANKQARHFLGLLSEESLTPRQKFLSLVRSGYQCYPGAAWQSWPQRPSGHTPRYLIYSPSNQTALLLLKVEIMEQMILDGQTIWVVVMNNVARKETAVTHLPTC
jgi:PAS domain-containing protein